jgi:hypothetical protein
MNQYIYNLIYTLRESMKRGSDDAFIDALNHAVADVLRDSPVPASMLSINELNLGISPHGACKADSQVYN